MKSKPFVAKKAKQITKLDYFNKETAISKKKERATEDNPS